MTTLYLNEISDNLYLLLLSLNRHIFNPTVLTKKFNVPHSHIKVLFYLIHHGPISISKMIIIVLTDNSYKNIIIIKIEIY